MSRTQISKKVRFEVFKRDSFKCQYCGAKAPEVLLHVDHIHPVAEGGDNEIINLITSCQSCNSGKGARKLSDNSELEKQHEQLAALQERRTQIEMMVEWKKSLSSIDDFQIDKIVEIIPCFEPNEMGRKDIRSLLKRFGFELVFDATERAFDRYFDHETDAEKRSESWNKAFSKIGGICNSIKNPDKAAVYYIRGILRNRLSYINDAVFFNITNRAMANGVDAEEIKHLAKTVTSWTQYREHIADFYLDDSEAEDGQS